MTQSLLPLDERRKPEPSNADLEAMLDVLAPLAPGECLTAAEILQRLGKPATESGKRTLRAIAEHSGGRIIGTQQGYILTARADKETVDHAVNSYRSQADRMKARSVAIQQQFYGRR